VKYLPAPIIQFIQNNPGLRSARLLLRFLTVMALLVTIYGMLFRVIMVWEGREYSWLTGFYWTLTTMSTLGLGDITFTSDMGRFFTMLVLLSGIVFLMALLPFAFIQFFLTPWMQAKAAPRTLPEGTSGHIILINYDPLTISLIRKLKEYKRPYVLLVSDLSEALRLYDLGIKVLLGLLDDPQTYRQVRVENATLVVATASDVINTKVAFTVREVSEDVPIIATADDPDSADILKLAGCSRVLQIVEKMGQFFARRIHGSDTLAHVIGKVDQLLIAESNTAGTPMVGKTLRECKLRELVGVNVVGIWERGQFKIAEPETRINAGTVLVLAGSQDQLDKYTELFFIHYVYHLSDAPVIIIGGGRVGRASARTLKDREINYCIVEKAPQNISDKGKYVFGNAADLEVLKKAGIMKAPSVVITTHDDDINIYLSIYCRRLRPEIQIISRATNEKNISTLHRAGADFVMSFTSMGVNTILNHLKHSNILMVLEGLDVFNLNVPDSLVGKKIVETSFRQETGCSIIGVRHDNTLQINPDPNLSLPAEAEIILIGSKAAEKKFLKLYGNP